MQGRNMTFRISESSGPSAMNTLFRIVRILLVAAAVFGAAYLLLTYVVGPTINFIGLAIMAALGIAMIWRRDRTDLIGVDLNQSELAVRTEIFRRQTKKLDTTEDEYLKRFASVFGFLLFVWLIAVAVVMGYAMNPHYQMVPINYVGFGTLLVMIFIAGVMIYTLTTLEAMKTKPYKESSAFAKIRAKIIGLVLITYPAMILAVNVGVIR